MLDTTPLTDATEAFADRLRAAPLSRLHRGAAAEALALARELSRRAQLAEAPDAPPRRMPEAGPFVVGDQLTVAARDLAVALAGGSAAPTSAAGPADAADPAGGTAGAPGAAGAPAGAQAAAALEEALLLVREARARAEL